MLKTFMKLFVARNGQKFAHFMQVSFSFTCMQEVHIQIGLFLPSFPPREEAEISSVRKSPKATPTSQADAVTHTPVAKSQSRSIYYPPPSLALPRIPMCFSSWPRRGSQTLLSKLLALPASLPLLYLSSTWPGPASAGLLGKIPG